MKIQSKEILHFRKEDLTDIIKNDISGFRLLEMGDHMSLWKLFCAMAGDAKPDIFVTMCPLLLENRENIEKNTSIKIATWQEAYELTKGGKK